MSLFTDIIKWSKQYDFTFQFWGEGNNNVFISKASVEIISFGGASTPQAAMKDAIAWCIKTNSNKVKDETDIHRCNNCGCRIAPGNDYCGECLCEDDGY